MISLTKIFRILQIITFFIPLWAEGAQSDWTGSSSDDLTLSTNWNPNTVPTATGNTAGFGTLGATTATPTVSSGGVSNSFACDYITFTGSTIYTITDETTFTLVGSGGTSTTTGVSNTSSGTQFFLVNSGGTLTFQNDCSALITDSTQTVTYTAGDLSTAGTITFSDSSTAGAANFILNNSSTLNFNDTSTGGTTAATLTASTLNTTHAVTLGALVTDASSSVNIAGALTIGNSNSQTIASIIADNGSAGSLVKQGSGGVTLSGVNTYTGSTTVNAGSLFLSDSGTIASSSGLTMSGSASFVISGSSGDQTIQDLTSGSANNLISLGAIGLTLGTSNSTAYAGAIQGTGSVTKQGTGTLTLSGANTYSGGTVITAGAIAVSGSGTMSATGSVDISTGATFSISGLTGNLTIGDLIGASASTVNLGSNTLTVGTSTSTTFAGAIIGAGNFTKQGTGTLTLTGVSNYSGTTGTTINGGTLALSGSGALLSTSNLTLADSTIFDISGSSGDRSIGAIASSGSSSSIVLGANMLTSTTSTTTTFAGIISGTGAFTETGAGSLTFTNANTYTGGTTIGGGSLILSGSGALASTGALDISGGSSIFDISGITATSSTIGDLSGASGSSIVLGSKNLIAGGSSSTVFAGIISGTGGVTKQGSGTLALSDSNTYTGGTTISEGTLSLSGSGSLASTGSVSLSSSGTTFDISAISGASTTIGDLSGVSGSFISLGSKILVIDESGTTTCSSVISGTGGLTKEGAGTLTLGGTSTYSGANELNDGTVNIDNTSNLGSAASTVSFDGGTLGLTNSLSMSRTLTLNANGGTINTNSHTGTFSGVIDGSGALSKSGSGILVLSGVNTYSGGTIVNQGTVSISHNDNLGDTSGDLTLNGAILALSANVSSARQISLTSLGGSIDTESNTGTFSGVITGSGALIKTGSGTLVPSAINTYSGGTYINEGTIEINDHRNLGAEGKRVTFNGGTLKFDADLSLTRDMTFNSGGGSVDTNTHSVNFLGKLDGSGMLIKEGSGTLLLGNPSNSYSGGTTVFAGTLEGTTSSLQGNISDHDTVFFNQATEGTYSGIISGTGTVNIAGGGTVIFTGANTYANTDISGGGTTLQGTTTSLQGFITINNSSTLLFQQTTNGTFDGEVAGIGGFVIKSGSGTVTFSEDSSTFDGATFVNEGQLVLNSELGGDVTVGTATLSGTGTVLGNLTIGNGGMIAPGPSFTSTTNGIALFNHLKRTLNTPLEITHSTSSSFGTLTVQGDYSQNSGSTYDVRVSVSGASSRIEVDGAASIANNTTVHVVPLEGAINTSVDYLILEAAGGVTGQYTHITSTFPTLAPTLSYTATQVFLNLNRAYINIARTHNQIAVANQLDSIDDPTADEAAVFDAMILLSESDARRALDQMGGQPYAAAVAIAGYNNRQVFQQIYQPLRSLVTNPCFGLPCGCEGWTSWGTINAGQLCLNSNREAAGVRDNNYEFTLGAYQIPTSEWLIGGSFTYSHDSTNYRIDSYGNNNTILASFYSLYRPQGYYLLTDFILGGSFNHIRRVIDMGSLVLRPHGQQNMFQTAAYVEAAKDFWYFNDNLLIQPFVAIEGDYFYRLTTNERGQGALNLSIRSKSYNTFYTYLGMHLSALDFYHLGFDIAIDCSWQCLFSSQKPYTFSSHFRQFGSYFTIEGVPPGNNIFNWGLYLSKEWLPECPSYWTSGWSFFADIAGSESKNTSSYAITLGFTKDW